MVNKEQDWFVDREVAMGKFQELCQPNASHSIMLIEADREMGKTWLLKKMEHYCQHVQKIPVSRIDFHQTFDQKNISDFLGLIRLWRRRFTLPDEQFEQLDNTISLFTETVLIRGGKFISDLTKELRERLAEKDIDAITVSMGIDSKILFGRSMTYEDEILALVRFAFRFEQMDKLLNVIIKVTQNDAIKIDKWRIEYELAKNEPISHANLPVILRHTNNFDQKTAHGQITEAFWASIANITQTHQRVVFLVDAYEAASTETQGWFGDFFFPYLGQKNLEKVIVVVAGQDVPNLSAYKDLEARIAPVSGNGKVYELPRFTYDHIKEYIETKRSLTLSEETLKIIESTSGGIPGNLASQADQLLCKRSLTNEVLSGGAIDLASDMDASQVALKRRDWLTSLLNDGDSLVAESFYVAAVPYWYDESMFARIRQNSDGLDAKLMKQVNDYSFVETISYGRDDPSFSLDKLERKFFNEYCIKNNKPTIYRTYHKRAFAHKRVNPESDDFLQANILLYHQFFYDFEQAKNQLIYLSRIYMANRQLAAVDNLLDTVKDAHRYLQLLDEREGFVKASELQELEDLQIYLRLRLAQIRGTHFGEGERRDLARLLEQNRSSLFPYVKRLQGRLGLESEDEAHAATIKYLEEAIKAFDDDTILPLDPVNREADRAETQIDLGEAYVALSESLQGSRLPVTPENGRFSVLRYLHHLFLTLPLLVYLSRAFKWRILVPQFWSVLHHVDWVIAQLYTRGFRQFVEADVPLEALAKAAVGSGSNPQISRLHRSLGNLADQQLGELYLKIGDARQAQRASEQLLADDQEMPLSPYQRALTKIRLAQALLWLGKPTAAQAQLVLNQDHQAKGEPKGKPTEGQVDDENTKNIATIMEQYNDHQNAARAYALWGDAWQAKGEPAKAKVHYEKALDIYRGTDEIKTTEIYEKLDNLQGITHEQKVPDVLVYPARFRHQSTVRFQQLSLILLFMIVFPIAISTIRLQNEQIGIPDITFQPAPLLKNENDFTPQLNQGVTDIVMDTANTPTIFTTVAITLLFTYLIGSTSFGVWTMRRLTPTLLDTRRGQKTIRLHGTQLTQGDPANGLTIDLKDVTKVVATHTYFFGELMRDNTNTTLITPDQQLTINGNTAHYAMLQQRIEQVVPEDNHVRQSYTILPSKMGWVFLATILFFSVLTLVLTSLSSEQFSDILTTSFLLNYSLADIHTYFFLGLFVPPIWWFLIQPIRPRQYTKHQDKLPLFLGNLGFFLAIITFNLIPNRIFLTQPDIFLPLTAVVFLGSAVWLHWRATPKTLYRSLANIVAIIVSGFLIIYMLQELVIYHYMVQGGAYVQDVARSTEDTNSVINTGSDQERFVVLTMCDEPVKIYNPNLNTIAKLRTAERYYIHAVELNKNTQFLGGIRPTTLARLYANLGAVRLQMGTIYVKSDDEAQTLTIKTIPEIYECAVNDYEQATDLEPSRADYFVWLAFTQNSLGFNERAFRTYDRALAISGDNELDPDKQAKALIGQGWIYLEADQPVKAEAKFRDAVDVKEEPTPIAESTKADAYLGLGYTQFKQEQTQSAIDTWHKAAQLNVDNPLIFISLGTGYWDLGKDENGCTYYQESINQFSLSLNDELPQSKEAKAYTYRTMGQIYWLLGQKSCYPEGVTSENVLRRTAFREEGGNSYLEAVKLDPETAYYHNGVGRLLYSAWFAYQADPAFQVARDLALRKRLLEEGLPATELALQSDPDNKSYQDWFNLVSSEAVVGTIEAGDKLAGEENWEDARGYYQLVADSVPTHGESAFDVGLMAFQLADYENSLTWYAKGIERANNNVAILCNAWNQIPFDMEESHDILPLFELMPLQQLSPAEHCDLITLIERAVENGDFELVSRLYLELMAQDSDPNWTLLKESLFLVATQPSAIRQPILDTIRQVLPEYEPSKSLDSTDVESAVSFAFMAQAVDRPDMAGYWYNEAIRRMLKNSGVYFTVYRPFREDLRRWWEVTETRNYDEILDAFEVSNQQTLLIEYPDLNDNGLYSRWRAWYHYHLAYAAFLTTGDLSFAEDAVKRAYPEADKAANLGQTGSLVVNSYLRETALTTYFLARGKEAFGAEAYELAFTDFVQAVTYSQAKDNQNAQEDSVESAFMAGLTAMYVGEYDEAVYWYQDGVDRARQFDLLGTMLADALLRLQRADLDDVAELYRDQIVEILSRQ